MPQPLAAECYGIIVIVSCNPYPIVCLTIPVLGLQVLHLRMCRIKVPIAVLAVVVFRAVPIVLFQALLAPKVDVATIAQPMSMGVGPMLLISRVMGKRAIAAIAVGHLVGSHGAVAGIPTSVGFISGVTTSSAGDLVTRAGISPQVPVVTRSRHRLTGPKRLPVSLL